MYTDSDQIKAFRQKYKLSLSQLGNLIGVPGSTIKRWEDGVSPRKAYQSQIALVMAIISDPDMVYAELGRQGIRIEKKHWDSFAKLIKGTDDSTITSTEINITLPENRSFTIVKAVSGIMLLIAREYLPKIPMGKINKITKLLSELL